MRWVTALHTRSASVASLMSRTVASKSCVFRVRRKLLYLHKARNLSVIYAEGADTVATHPGEIAWRSVSMRVKPVMETYKNSTENSQAH